MDDLRVAWLATRIAAHCKSPAVDAQHIHKKSLSRQNAVAITAFLDSTALALFVVISYQSEDVDLTVTTDVTFPIPSDGASLAFTKSSADPLNGLDEMESGVMLCSITANVAACLFYVLRNVYSPMLASGAQPVGSNVQDLLSNLDAALTKEAAKQSHALFASDLYGILRPSDEVRQYICTQCLRTCQNMSAWFMMCFNCSSEEMYTILSPTQGMIVCADTILAASRRELKSFSHGRYRI